MVPASLLTQIHSLKLSNEDALQLLLAVEIAAKSSPVHKDVRAHLADAIEAIDRQVDDWAYEAELERARVPGRIIAQHGFGERVTP